MAPNPAFPDPRIFHPSPDPATPRDDQGTEDLSPASVIVANAVALAETLSDLVPLPPPTAITASPTISGAVQLRWTTAGKVGEHEMVAHVGAKAVVWMAIDMAEPFDVALEGVPSGGSYPVGGFPDALLGSLMKFRADRPWSSDDEDTFAEDVERAAKVAAGDIVEVNGPDMAGDPNVSVGDSAGCPKGDGCCRAGGQAYQDHAEWPMAAPVDPLEYWPVASSAPISVPTDFAKPRVFVARDKPLLAPIAPRIIATRDQLLTATLPYAKSDLKAAVPILLWPLLKPFIEALLAAFFKSLFSAKSEFAARGVGIAIEDQ